MSKPNVFAALSGIAVMGLALVAFDASAQTRGQRRPAEAAAVATPEENLAAAQAAATAANLGCQVTEATLLGAAAGGTGNLYEAACATGPGYIITASTPPEAIDCVLLTTQLAKTAAAPAAPAPEPARRGRRAEPEIQPVSCKLPANQDILAVQAAYAKEAGITCQVDAASPIGVSPGGATVYEIGCVGTDGYRINKDGAVWTKSECIKLIAANGTCSFTTPEEQNATVAALLVGSAADDCVPAQVRYMGGNANGEFYEAKCASAAGYILRVKDNKAEQVYACAVASQIGGGCTLTPSAAAPAAPATEATPGA